MRSYGVGITTLEEVFLKIGHGEVVEQERFEREQAALKGSAVNDTNESEKNELDEYTIAENQETSVFMLHLRALTRKKILMQIRDMKTLGIDTIFPVLLIIAGLAAATVSIFKDGIPREMSPYIYNQVPMKLIYNSNS